MIPNPKTPWEQGFDEGWAKRAEAMSKRDDERLAEKEEVLMAQYQELIKEAQLAADDLEAFLIFRELLKKIKVSC